jgi:sugar/nucleoside kinase (ribokinase family)
MSLKKLDAVVVGELNIDLVLWNVPMPENEKEKLAEDMRFAMGSSSAITAHNLSMIGSKVGFVAKAGQDTFGDFMIDGLTKGGVETSHVIRDASLKTGVTIVLANPPKKALLTYMGAMTEMTVDDINFDYISQARHIHVGCYYLQTGLVPGVSRLFAKAKDLGLSTSLDTNWDPAEKWSKDIYKVLEHTDIFLPNDDEAVHIAHAKTLNDAVENLSKIVKVLAVKKGSDGAMVSVGGEIFHDEGFQVKATETTGAGDSFNAGFIHSYLKGESWDKCLRFGNACGALAVTAIGGTGAYQDKAKVREQIQSFLEQ